MGEREVARRGLQFCESISQVPGMAATSEQVRSYVSGEESTNLLSRYQELDL